MTSSEFFFARIVLSPLTATWWICAGFIVSYLKSAFGSFWGFVVFVLGLVVYGLPLLLHFGRFALVFLGTYFDRFATFSDLVEGATWFPKGKKLPRSAPAANAGARPTATSSRSPSPQRSNASNVPSTTNLLVMAGRSQIISFSCPNCRKTTKQMPFSKENWAGKYQCSKCGGISYSKGIAG